MSYEVTATMHGPIAAGTDGAQRAAALADVVRELTASGEAAVVESLYPGHGLDTGHYRRSVHGVIRDRLHGEVNDSGVIYGPWLEGTSSRNARTRFKGYASFRRAKQKLDAVAGGIIAAALRRAKVVD